MHKATVEYQITTYPSKIVFNCEIEVNCDKDTKDEEILAKARELLSKSAGLAKRYYESYKIVSR